MSKFVPQEGGSKRPKRASRACDHCRWKRLKCSDEQKDQSCMNCVIYGIKCQYTPQYSPGGSGRKRSDTATSSSKPPPTNKKLPSGSERASQSPGRFEQDSPSSNFVEDLAFSSPTGTQGLVARFAAARRLAMEFIQANYSHAEIEDLAERLDHYAQYLTSLNESATTPAGVLSDDTGLPPSHISNSILQAYTDGFQGGYASASAQWRTAHMEANSRQSRSTLEATSSPIAGRSASSISVDIASMHQQILSAGNSPRSLSPSVQRHHIQVPQAQLGFTDPASAAIMGLGIDDYPMPMSLGHTQVMPSTLRNQFISDTQGRPTPRSIPQGLNVGIPGSNQSWSSIATSNVEGSHNLETQMRNPSDYSGEHEQSGYYQQ